MENTFTGTGANFDGKETRFKVWAPHAEKVFVAGDFNGWNEEANPLKRGDDDYWEVQVPKAAPGAEYKYVIKNGDQVLWRNDPVARAMTNSAGNSIIVDDSDFDWGDDDNFQLRGWNELVIYEMHLGTYHRGDDKQTVGSFDDAIARLDHIVDLGVNVIELMPVAEFAGDQSWGYNPAFPFAIESDYGGVNGLKGFVKACHERGIAVFIDVVYNHFGPSDLDLWQFDGWEENGKGGIYFYNDWRASTPWGDTRPDYGRNEVRQYIRDNALMWLDVYHVDGLRMDMTFYMRSVDDGADIPDGWSLAQWINDEISQHHPGAITIAEDLRSNEWITKTTGEGGAGFGSQWDEQFVHPIRSVLTEQDDCNRSMDVVAGAIGFSYNGDPAQRVIYTESHDEVANGKSRVPTEVDEYDQEGYWARKRSILGACLTMTSPGIPMIFQGQEFLETGHFQDCHEMDWASEPHEEGVRNIYRDLIRLRTNREGKTQGLQSGCLEFIACDDENKVICLARGEGDNQVIVAMNFSKDERHGYRIGFTQSGKWKVIFQADAKVYGGDFGDTATIEVVTEPESFHGLPQSATVNLGSYDCIILIRA
ncbi:MAG: alpha-amylase family glycosyl hydrolase [Verrucomicrobiales bacterium]|nr:alpha-amylase family glycosyl hydrolase [Verrucomicrobiales bacterium]